MMKEHELPNGDLIEVLKGCEGNDFLRNVKSLIIRTGQQYPGDLWRAVRWHLYPLRPPLRKMSLVGMYGARMITEARMLAMPTCDELGRIPDASLGMRRR